MRVLEVHTRKYTRVQNEFMLILTPIYTCGFFNVCCNFRCNFLILRTSVTYPLVHIHQDLTSNHSNNCKRKQSFKGFIVSLRYILLAVIKLNLKITEQYLIFTT